MIDLKTEIDIQRDIMTVARGMGFKVYRMNAGNPKKSNFKGSPQGTPDLLIAMAGGRSMWVEVKQPGKRPTEVQIKAHKELREMGHAVTVCTSAEEFVAAVSEVAA